jgi:hypothetical protein
VLVVGEDRMNVGPEGSLGDLYGAKPA